MSDRQSQHLPTSPFSLRGGDENVRGVSSHAPGLAYEMVVLHLPYAVVTLSHNIVLLLCHNFVTVNGS